MKLVSEILVIKRSNAPQIMKKKIQASHSRPWWIYYVHICISYLLAHLKYLNKYVLTAHVSSYVKYVNTFVCQKYLCKIVVPHICVHLPGMDMQSHLSYINMSHTNVLTYFTHVETFAVDMYLFKYFKNAK
jgi:hypothetical protein